MGVLFLSSGCQPEKKTPLVVFCAGSLIQPFADLEIAFEAENPDIDVLNECHGSIQVIRHVTDLHEEIDVVATADAALIPMLMYQASDPATGNPYADWYIRFATNRLGIAYTDSSRHSDEITPENWWEVLGRQDVSVGIADPRFDASGYRTLMVYKLAEIVYNEPALFFDMFSGQFSSSVTTQEEEGITIIHVPEILETKNNSHIVIRGASIQLIALLESGDLDYAFEYESVIRQHGLKWLPLPDELNLGSPAEADFYKDVQVYLDFQRFTTVKPVFRGEQIAYGITIPSNAPHPKAAEAYFQFILGTHGREIMEDNFHPLLDPLLADGYENIPASLQKMVTSVE